MKSITLKATILLMSLFLITSCFESRRKIKKIDPQFSKYVSGYTSGMISNKQSIKIELADQYGNPGGLDSTKNLYDKPDSNVLEDIFKFSPNIKGRAKWVNRRLIEFVPSEPLEPNQLYNIVFELEKVAKVKKDFEAFEFQIAAFPQRTTVSVNGLKTYNAYNTEYMKLSGSLRTSDFSDFTEVQKIIEAELEGENLNVKWTTTTSNKEYFFYIDSVKRGSKKQIIHIEWDASHIRSENKGEFTFQVPAMGDFSIENSKVIDEDDQMVELYFSDPILYKQNLEGIVTINGVNDLTYKIEGNVVKLFIDSRIEGIKELNVSRGIKNYKGFTMNEAYTLSLEFEAPKPKVKLIGQGNILPNSGGLIFPFEAVALKKVDVRVMKIKETNVHQFLQVNELNGHDELNRIGQLVAEKTIDLDYDKSKNLKTWNTHVIDLSKLISPEPGAIYRVSIKFNKSYSTCDCDVNESASNWWDRKPEAWSESTWNQYDFEDGYSEWHNYYDESSVCENNFYYGKAVNRNIIASDLGLIYKLDDKKHAHAFVSNMITTEPIPNCKIEYYDYSRNSIANGTTDENGMLESTLKNKPFLMIASYGKQRAYLKLRDANANSLSKFEVDGSVIQKGIKGFLYSERGVWRPGDSIYLNFILEDKKNQLPSNYPVHFELRNPDGAVITNMTSTVSVHDLYDFRTTTSEDAITGNYTAQVIVGNQRFTKIIKIETIKPNRLKIKLDIPEDYLSASSKDTIGKYEVKWLHGAVANALKMTVDVSFSPTKTYFKDYKAYTFDSPLKQYHSEEMRVFDGRLDASGHAKLTKKFSCGNQASGMLKANFITRVFEEGGDFSTDRFTVNYSPYKSYVGLKVAGEDDNEYLETNATHPLNIICLNEIGTKIENGKVHLKIYKLQRRWWYEEERDLSDYVARNGTVVFADTVIQVSGIQSVFNMHFSDEDYGRYLITATDLNNGHQSGKLMTIDWPYWRRKNRSGNENARMLNFFTDKTDYKTGEKIKISIPSESNGKALISIENSSSILKKFWVKTTDKETHVEVEVTPDMTPNVYVHVTFIQKHSNTKNDLPIRMYGIVPINVINPKTVLEPIIVCSTEWEPEKMQTVSVKEKNGQGMAYTLAVVDEGLLDLTRFKTPNPWHTFYAKEAIGVKTWDMYDQVIGAFAGKIDKLLSIGGDGDIGNTGIIKANRFVPMVKVLGPFYLPAGKTMKHKIEVPNYVGSVRVMVVAGKAGMYGAAQSEVAVKKPLMVLATLPRVLGPSETVLLPVDVFAMSENVKNVSVKVELNDMLFLDGESTKELKFKTMGDKVINFKLKVNNKIGIGKVKITAISGREKSEQLIEIDVRASNPRVVDAKELVLKPGQSLEEMIQYTGIVGTNFTSVEFSNIPSIGLDKRLTELIQYPHGCIEQTTSSVFPQLFVNKVMQLDEKQKSEINKNVKAGIKRMQKFQVSSGGFAYWPGESYVSEWGTNYAGRFIIEAEKQGYVLPVNMKSRWLKYQAETAKNWQNNEQSSSQNHYNESRQLMQSTRLFVLAEAGHAELGAMNRMRENNNISDVSRWQLAAAFYLVGQKEVAKKMIVSLSTKVDDYRELSYAYGSNYRDQALILEVLSLMKENSLKSEELMKVISKKMNSTDWLSTQETAYGLLSITNYLEIGNPSNSIDVQVKYEQKLEKIKFSNKSFAKIKLNEMQLKSKQKIDIKNNGTAKLYVKLMVEGIPLIGDKKASANHIEMDVIYKNLKGQLIDVSKIQQGQDFLAIVTIKNKGSRGNLEEMTLNQIFPSGWEIRNTRLDGVSSMSQARYQDFRDDRVYSYYELRSGASKTFVVQLNATFQGRFYLPSLYSEAMYDQSIHAQLPGKWVEVVNENNNLAIK